MAILLGLLMALLVAFAPATVTSHSATSSPRVGGATPLLGPPVRGGACTRTVTNGRGSRRIKRPMPKGCLPVERPIGLTGRVP